MPTTDGRHARSDRTRATVAEAMLDCFEEGLLRPGAKEVAERAGVSTRAVFRHFDNMEALLEEASGLQIERVISQLPPVTVEGTQEERIAALVARTSQIFELVAPVRRAALLREPFSQSIRERHAWMRTEIRKWVRRVFAEELSELSEAERRDLVAGLRALLSFSYWDELRRHERHSVSTATRILSTAIAAGLRS